MATVYHASIPVDLAAPSRQRLGAAQFYYGDNESHVFTALVADTADSDAGLRAGTVSGTALRADGVTVPLEGEKGEATETVTFADGRQAQATPCSVTLPQAAFAIPGTLQISIKLTDGTTATTVLSITGTVIRTETDSAVDPGEILPDLAELQAAAQEALDAADDATDAAADARSAAQSGVRYDAAQTLTDAQKGQARTNIGAAAVDELKSAIDAGKQFDFIQLNSNNKIINPIIYDDILTSGNQLRMWRYSGTTATTKKASDGIGYAVLVESAKAIRYIMPLSDIVTGEYYATIKRSGLSSYNGRLIIYAVYFVAPSYGVLSTTTLDGKSGTDPEWTFSIDIENILSNYPTANALVFEWTNTASGSAYYEHPIVCLSSATDKTFWHTNGQYKAQGDIDRLVSTSFDPGIYVDKTITYQETQGYYGYGSSTFNNFSNIYVSEEIAVSGYVMFTGATWANVPAIIYYDASHNWLGNYPASKPDDETTYNDVVINLPANVAYVRMQDISHYRTAQPAPKLAQATGFKSKEATRADAADFCSRGVLYGKKLVTAGDSYTAAYYTGANAGYNGKNYGYYVARRNNMEFINAGISGSIMALDKTYVEDPEHVDINTRSPFSYQRYLAVPADTDYLTIWFGINDYAHSNLGSITDTTNETFYGAWNVVLGYFLEHYPFMKIGVIVTTGASAEYRQAVRDVAQKWGYPYLDWVEDVKIPAFFDRTGMSTDARALRRAAFGYDDFSAHPNPAWHEYASTIYENFLLSL